MPKGEGQPHSSKADSVWGRYDFLPTFELPVIGNSLSGTTLTLGRGQQAMAPPPGTMWLLRRILIIPWPNPQTVITGAAGMYVTTSPDTLGPWDCRDTTQQIPNTSTWSRGEATVDPSDYIITDISGLPNNQVVCVNVTVEWLPSVLYRRILAEITEKFMDELELPEKEREDFALSAAGGLGSKEHSYRQLDVKE